ncbi:hypothetical protein [Eoetvoesiella caeni]
MAEINSNVDTTLLDLATKAYALASILQTLHVALPEDKAGCEVPTRTLVSHVMGMAEQLADSLADKDFAMKSATRLQQAA